MRLTGLSRKRTKMETLTSPTQINGRARSIWLIDLGYSSDNRYVDKVVEKKE
jgi:hypothetical protein